MIAMEAVHWGGRWLRHGDGFLWVQDFSVPKSQKQPQVAINDDCSQNLHLRYH